MICTWNEICLLAAAKDRSLRPLLFAFGVVDAAVEAVDAAVGVVDAGVVDAGVAGTLPIVILSVDTFVTLARALLRTDWHFEVFVAFSPVQSAWVMLPETSSEMSKRT